jgi:hypothetical protein
MLALGVLGALLEILFAPQLWIRPLFTAAAALAALGYWLNPLTDRPLGIVGVAAFCLVIMFGGGAMLFLRWRDRPRDLVTLGLARVDVQRGLVLVFEAPPAEQAAPGPRRIEVLPLSTLLHTVDGVPTARFQCVPVASVGVAADSDSEASERPLSAAERQELLDARPRLRRTSLGRTLVATWAVAAFLHYAAEIISAQFDLRLAILGWLIALARGAFLAVREVRWHRRLAADLAAGSVTRHRPPAAGPGLPRVIEFLPRSEAPWTIDGAPAPWRLAGK